MGTLMESRGGKMSRNVNFRFAISSTVTRSYRLRKIGTCTLGKYAWMGWTNVSLALLTFNIHRLFLTAVPDKVVLSILKLLFAEPRTFKASYFNRITKSWNFVCSLKSPSSFYSKHSFEQFVYKTVLTTLVNTYEVERLHVDISDNLFLSHVEVTVPTTFLFTFVGNVHLGFELIFFKGKWAI